MISRARARRSTLQARPVEIDALRIVSHSGETTTFEAECGKGTYVRAIARDLGLALGCLLIDTSEALSSLPHLIVNDDQAHRLKMGNPILVRGRDAPVAESEAYATARGKLVAIGEIGQGEFRPKRVFG
jgi:tRNA pseudouridine55 synthase